MVQRQLTPPDSSYFLFGPRGTGKSTFVRAHHPDALVVDLLDPEEERQMAARPERLRERIDGASGTRVVVVDEIQKVPALLEVVHGLIERKDGRQFVLTGSSARKLRRGGVNLLAGRALLRSMHPFLASELGDAFDLQRALTSGLVPVVVDATDPAETLRTYAALYVREEVQQERLVRNVGDFARFLEAVSFSHAAVLNISGVARECAVHRKAVESYVGILEDLLLAFRLPVFTRRAKRSTVAHPKLYLFDAGVFRSLRPSGPLDRPETIDGAALEGLVAQHLRAWIDYSGSDAKLSFWRTRTGLEVDFVVYGNGVFDAIEVKHAGDVRPADLRGLRAFGDEYPEARRVLLYRGNHALVRDGVHVIPCDAYLRAIHPHRPLPPAAGAS